MNIPSITSLKRGYLQMVQDLRDDYKPAVNHNPKLLSFKKVDQKGRIHKMEIDAQLHGMFFLSEFPSGAGDGSPLNAELTCYRHNLFQISGSLCFPQIPLSVMLETGETSQIKNLEVSISAIESVDGHPVRLIVIPWKTPPPNSPESSQGPDQEPPLLPLIPWSEEEEENAGDHYAIYPIGWRRLRFRMSYNNTFVLHLKLHGTLANGTKLVLSELTTGPYCCPWEEKEILLGSSAGSRGLILVETGHGIVAQTVILNKPPYDSRPRVSSMEMPRSPFTFSAPKQMPQSPMQMRSSSYPTTWNPSSQISMPPNPESASYPAASMAPRRTLPENAAFWDAPSYTAEPQEMPTSMPSVQLSLAAQDQQQQQPPPIRTQYATYVQGTSAAPHLSLLTTADNSLKSPRHANHQTRLSSEYRYGPPPPPTYSNSGEIKSYLPSSQSWTTTAGEQPSSASVSYDSAGGDSVPQLIQRRRIASSTTVVAAATAATSSPTTFGGIWGRESLCLECDVMRK
ncbi:hypothetical protein B0H66DRAFT_620410 [Apodospora peruviana]|uniref:NDT80 domain-containing protein n=1 Tax=Apodospora peruviana TaxID=516989 RepID=A0AAE0IE95_9PEZI|nr:hypothetical protein B0H66DRAFT_620410 [Apodospora peruviana]